MRCVNLQGTPCFYAFAFFLSDSNNILLKFTKEKTAMKIKNILHNYCI